MKDGSFSKLLITETGHRPTYYQQIVDTLPVLCADKNFPVLDKVIWTKNNLVEMDFMLTYPNANLWSTAHHVQVSTINPTDASDAVTGERPACFEMIKRTHVFDQNSRRSNYRNKNGISRTSLVKFLIDRKDLITIIFGQYDETTKTKVALGATYTANCRAGRLIDFVERLRTICFSSDDGGLSYGPYKQVVAVKSMNNYTNNEPYDPHGFKEQVKIKYEATKAVAGKFPNGTATLM